MRLHVVLPCVLLLAACTSSVGSADRPTPSTTPPSTTPPPATPTPAFAVKVVPAPDGEFTLASFQSPSSNIQCSLGREENGNGWARCDVRERSWQLPPRPTDCDADWGSVATVTTDGGRATMGACVSDAAGGPEVLAYGHAIRLGKVECRSSTSGMECVAHGTSHGFFVSKASYRVH